MTTYEIRSHADEHGEVVEVVGRIDAPTDTDAIEQYVTLILGRGASEEMRDVAQRSIDAVDVRSIVRIEYSSWSRLQAAGAVHHVEDLWPHLESVLDSEWSEDPATARLELRATLRHLGQALRGIPGEGVARGLASLVAGLVHRAMDEGSLPLIGRPEHHLVQGLRGLQPVMYERGDLIGPAIEEEEEEEESQ